MVSLQKFISVTHFTRPYYFNKEMLFFLLLRSSYYLPSPVSPESQSSVVPEDTRYDLTFILNGHGRCLPPTVIRNAVPPLLDLTTYRPQTFPLVFRSIYKHT